MPEAIHTAYKQYAIPVYTISLVRDGVQRTTTSRVGSSVDASAVLTQYLDGVDREHFVVLLLDQKSKIIGIHTVSIGSLTGSIVHPREVFKAAMLSNAASIICGHNHPSGDPAPSYADKEMTIRLVTAGKLLDMPVVDHIIIGDGTGRYMSFADEGLL